MTNVDAISVGRWTVGLASNSPAPQKPTLLTLEFDNREPINLAFLADQAVEIARAILDQYQNPPPRESL